MPGTHLTFLPVLCFRLTTNGPEYSARNKSVTPTEAQNQLKLYTAGGSP